MMEGPPPLLDGSSDEEAWLESENDSEGSGTGESSWSGSDVPGSPSWLLKLAAQSVVEPETCMAELRTGSSAGGNERVHLEEAASFVLARMKQTQSGLQVRCLAVLFSIYSSSARRYQIRRRARSLVDTLLFGRMVFVLRHSTAAVRAQHVMKHDQCIQMVRSYHVFVGELLISTPEYCCCTEYQVHQYSNTTPASTAVVYSYEICCELWLSRETKWASCECTAD